MQKFTFCLSLTLLFLSNILYGQNRGEINGILLAKDTKEPLGFATVTVYKALDTTIIDYALTNDDGSFEMKRLPLNQELRMIISFLGYEPVKENFTLSDPPVKNMGKVSMETSSNQLEEILIEAERPPIVFKKDTIEFNAASFKTRDGATVEELVKKLPGVVVDNDGNITVDGRAVTKVRVDGNEFFGGDPRVALRNLTSSMIAKVQISDDREEDPQQLLADDEVNKVINLKLKKEAKMKAFGKLYAGAGNKDRFEVGGIVNSFRGKYQISLLGYYNNLKKTNLSMEEVLSMGGFNQSRSRGGSSSINGIDFGTGDTGFPKSLLGGTNLNATWGKARANFQYFYSDNQIETEDLSYKEQIINPDSIFFYESESTSQKNTQGHNVGGGLRWEIDSTARLNFNINLSHSDGKQPGINSESTSFNDQNNYTQTFNTEEYPTSANTNFSTRFYYNKRLNQDGRNLSLRGSFSKNKGDNDLLSNFERRYFENAVDSVVFFDQLRTQYTNTQSFDISIGYSEPLFKDFFLELGAGYEPTLKVNNINTEQQFSNQTNWEQVDLLSNDFERDEQAYELEGGFRYQKDKLQISLTTEYNILDFNNSFGKELDNFEESYRFLSPRFRLVLDGWRFSYRYGYDVPDIDQLHPITNNTNPLNITLGNPNLDPSRSHNLYFSKFSYQGKWRYNMFARATLETDPIITTTQTNADAVTIRQPINFDENSKTAYLSAGLARPLNIDDHKINMDVRVYSGVSKSPFLINSESGFSNNFSVGSTVKFNYNFKDFVDFSPSYNLNFNSTTYDNTNYREVNITTHNLTGNFTFHLPWQIDINNDISYRYNPQVAPGFQKSTVLWHMALNKKVLPNKKGTIRLSVYDLLNQNISVYRYVNFNSIIDRQESTLQQYFMLSFIYDFSEGNKAPERGGPRGPGGRRGGYR
ncbi:outer membrane beta-barrel protein [Membranihabitans marinus]|uniref:outer membrane beta-barrel protein n=1 Tax=Membranihabitans marinus TaxID=1227546 RepID=UPI001F2F9562|nr:outer membrane beta-barrel protein [Membranihabitans marinus]